MDGIFLLLLAEYFRLGYTNNHGDINFMSDRRNRSESLDLEKITSELDKSKKLAERTSYRTEDMRQQSVLAKKNIPILEEILNNAPPKPVLPPKNKLIKVMGIIDNIQITKVKGYFTDREYNLTKSMKKESKDQVGALILAAIGNVTGSAVTAQNQTRVSDLCDFVRGKINGIDFYGWLGLTALHNGDYVEMAVSPDADGAYVVYAIANPKKRTISMTPRCKHGVIAASKDGMSVLIFFFILVALLIFIIGFLKDSALNSILIFECVYMILVSILLLATKVNLKRKPSQTTLLAEEIFTALGMNNPSDIDLKKITDEVIDKKDNNNEDLMPLKNSVGEYYYYY
jgi:hypothetical protein